MVNGQETFQRMRSGKRNKKNILKSKLQLARGVQ